MTDREHNYKSGRISRAGGTKPAPKPEDLNEVVDQQVYEPADYQQVYRPPTKTSAQGNGQLLDHPQAFSQLEQELGMPASQQKREAYSSTRQVYNQQKAPVESAAKGQMLKGPQAFSELEIELGSGKRREPKQVYSSRYNEETPHRMENKPLVEKSRFGKSQQVEEPQGFSQLENQLQKESSSFTGPELVIPTKPKARKKKKGLVALFLVVALLLVMVVGVFGYLGNVFDTGLLGSRVNKNYVPKDYNKNQVVNFLIVGIDNEEGRDYGAGLGMTDMILYANYDIANNRLNLLQIPRDSYVGEDVPTGGSGKINALLMNGPDKTSPINNLADVIEQQFKLPVDHYVAMDMDAMKTIVDTFGGLRVYVPQEMSNEGSYLPQGWQWLDGDASEFFVRNRKGVGFERADLDRLDNQRHFYSALFRRFLNLTPTDIVKLLPVFEYYCNTDIPMKDIFDLCYSALKLEAENVLFCKVPGATGPDLDPTGQGRSLYIVDVYGRGTPENPGTAELLNQYFRTYGEPVPAEELGLPNVTIPENYVLYEPNVQVMTEVQAPEGGTEVDVEPSF